MTTKYKAFRNYMHNELNIGREDIKEWTREAIAEIARKQAAQIGLNYIVEQEVKRILENREYEIIQAVGKALAGRLDIMTKTENADDENQSNI